MTGAPALGSLTSVRVGGALLPSDVLSAVLAGTVDGLSSSDYHLGGEAPRAAAARVWNHLLGVYRRFRDEVDKRPETDPAIGVTRERWLTLLLSELGYGRVPATEAGGITLQDKQYPVSHLWGATPIHLLGWNVPLDKRTPGVSGAAHRAPHAMVQELLNRDDTYLWAIVTNGRLLRLLRDSTTLTGQAYVEFDLETMFDGELFAEFALLYLLAHESRVEVPADGVPTDCWLEKWRTSAISQGVRALNLLRDGVQEAIETLGTGVLQHRANARLRADLDAGTVRLEDLHASLLRTVYRLLFWAVAEDRAALLDPAAPQQARERYAEHFSSARLRQLATRRHGSNHDDLWQAVTLVLLALGRTDGEPRLGLDGLGGLFLVRADDVLTVGTGTADQPVPYRIGNQPLLKAIRALSIVQPKGQPRRHVDFKNLGAEELGSIYESLLELVPRRDPMREVFTLESLAGNDRKTTGSYYTPSDLVELVLDTALDPVLDEAERQPDPEQALLALTVCDPAIGSGHFMVAAARRIASRVATARSRETDPTPTDVQRAMHDVVSRCIYGVDLNPMAADLAKVSLWLEAMTPGLPLSFLDHHIKVGNALLGTTPKLLHDGIPDTAYVPLTGDDKPTVAQWKKTNATERGGQTDLFSDHGLDVGNTALRATTAEVSQRAATAQTLADVSWAAQRYAAQQDDEQARRARRTADAWCVAFLSPKTSGDEPITHTVLERLSNGTASPRAVETVDTVAHRHRLFHWHLEFPDIFAVPDGGPANTPTGWTGGFSAVLGNPPWETLQMSEQEFFASRDSAIAEARTAAARKKSIAALVETNPSLHAEFTLTLRRGEAETSLIRGGRFPLCAAGKINTYSVFAEHFRATLSPDGHSGIITPTGLATDATTAPFFADTLRTQRLAAFYDFDNEAKIFPNVHHSFRFAVSSMTGGTKVSNIKLSFLNRHVSDVLATRFALAAAEILMLNPNTGTLPVFRTRRDAEITLSCYRRHPVLLRDGASDGNPWGLHFKQGLFNMASDSDSFVTAEDVTRLGAEFDGWAWTRADHRWLPLYEAKMLSHWNHRFSTYADATQAQLNVGSLPRLDEKQLDDPAVEPCARYWVAEPTVAKAVPSDWSRDWLLGWRDIARASDVRTFVPSVLPRSAVGHVFPLAFFQRPGTAPLLQCVWSSLIMDYLTRQKLSGTHLTYGVMNQLATPSPSVFEETPAWSDKPLAEFVRSRVLELTYTSDRVRSYADDVTAGQAGEPFRWIPERRDLLRADLEAAMLQLYEVGREDAEHVLDSFPVVRKYDERDHGEFRTKRLVLDAYDAMATAAATGRPYTSPLDPPAGQGPRHPGVDA